MKPEVNQTLKVLLLNNSRATLRRMRIIQQLGPTTGTPEAMIKVPRNHEAGAAAAPLAGHVHTTAGFMKNKFAISVRNRAISPATVPTSGTTTIIEAARGKLRYPPTIATFLSRHHAGQTRAVFQNSNIKGEWDTYTPATFGQWYHLLSSRT